MASISIDMDFLHAPLSKYDVFSEERSLHSVSWKAESKNNKPSEYLPECLSSIQNLLYKYRMYNKTADSPVTSGGLQNLITQALKKKQLKDTTIGKSIINRLRALYSGSEGVTVPQQPQDNQSDDIFQWLPVS